MQSDTSFPGPYTLKQPDTIFHFPVHSLDFYHNTFRFNFDTVSFTEYEMAQKHSKHGKNSHLALVYSGLKRT